MQSSRKKITSGDFGTRYCKYDKGISVCTDGIGIAASTEPSDLVSKSFASCVVALIFNTTNGERCLIHIDSTRKLKKQIDLFFKHSKGNLEFVLIYNELMAPCKGAYPIIYHLQKQNIKQMPNIEICHFFNVKFTKNGDIYIGKDNSNNYKKYTIFNTKSVNRLPASLITKIKFDLENNDPIYYNSNSEDEREQYEERVFYTGLYGQFYKEPNKAKILEERKLEEQNKKRLNENSLDKDELITPRAISYEF